MGIRYMLIHQFCAESGYTALAVRGKIREGVWLEGREYRKAPDGHVLIDIEGYYRWVEQGITTGFALVGKKSSKSASSSAPSSATKRSASPKPFRI